MNKQCPDISPPKPTECMKLNVDPDFNFKSLTEAQLKACMPAAKDENIHLYINALNGSLLKYSITTPRRQAAFLAQMAHECQSLSVMVENLNYSATGLMKVFPRYFPTLESAQAYERKPEMIANRVYSNRMGNGPEESGDGWRFRGRGPFMITGGENYDALSHALNYDFIKDPDALLKPGAAMLSAGWFWNLRDLNHLADVDYFEKITRKINGGVNGLADRIQHWERCKKALKVVS